MSGRAHVVWVGAAPADSVAEHAQVRRVVLDASPSLGLDVRDATLARARGLILAVSGPEDRELERARQLIIDARVHGLDVRILAPLADVDALNGRFTGWEPWLKPSVVVEASLPMVFDAFLDGQPGPAFDKSVKLSGDTSDLNPEETLLLKRAFNDAAQVRLTRLSGGGAKVFQAFATLRDSRIGLQPLPFFVKVDRRPKIQRELRNYADCTTLFVPFYARPNLDPARCALGCERGVLVGNFVEYSRPLGELVCDGTASKAIHSVFEDALRGWRRQAFIDPSKTIHAPLATSFGGAVYRDTMTKAGDRAEDVAKHAKKFGATRSAAALATAIEALPAIPHRCAHAHGDLHAENVRVRDGQSILIDFAATRTAPLTADPAALDASLILHSDENDESVWKTFVDDACAPESLKSLPAPLAADAPMAHLRDAVRDIRRIVLPDCLHPHEYATAMAIYLLRAAYRRPRSDEPADRRAYLFAAADKLVAALVNGA